MWIRDMVLGKMKGGYQVLLKDENCIAHIITNS